ncbi:MAG TPA: LCP family protein [Anaerolineales bacterium]|nr:LCP family protein [Anaerolineales bacterium]
MSKTSLPRLLAILTFLLTSCSAVPADAPAPPPFVLITAAPGASATPTAFQPPQRSRATPTSLYSIEVPTLEPFFPTATPSPTPIPPLQPSATVDLNSLFPTAAVPPPIAAGVGITPIPALIDNNTINFLLIGHDQGSPTSFRTDTLVAVILWPKDGQVSMISIPRDLWVYIPTVGMQRINTAYEYGLGNYPGGGAALLRDTIGYNLGIRIDHMAMVDFGGFSRIVDTLGGIDVPVACPYTDWRLIDPGSDPNNPDNWGEYTVQPGIVHMDGDLALWYARSREESSDFDRGRRQQEVLRAIFAQALKTNTLTRIPQLYGDFSSTITTDLGLADILKLAVYAPKLTNADIRGYYIRPPYVSAWVTPGGADVLLPNQPSLQQFLVQATTLSGTSSQRDAIRVEVQNGTPFNGWAALAANRLNYAGYQASTADAQGQNYASSVLIDMTKAQDPNARRAILADLGLPSARILTIPNADGSIQYRVILGSDYQPCFQPQDLSH